MIKGIGRWAEGRGEDGSRVQDSAGKNGQT